MHDEMMKVIESAINALMLYSPIIICNLGSKKSKNNFRDMNRKRNYKVYKDGIADSVLETAKLSCDSFELILKIEEWFDGPYPEELKDIFSKFVKYVDPLNLESCIVNLRNVKLENSVTFKEYIGNLLSVDSYSGSYYPTENIIRIMINKKYVLSHEFLHMASTSTINRYLCGFNVVGFDRIHRTVDDFGLGLNEGYTELLNGRIFNDGKSCSYHCDVQIVKLLECFFDDYRDMEYAYFHNDIDAVYKAFCKYGSREEYFNIINILDNYTNEIMPEDYLEYLKVQFHILEIIRRSNDNEKIQKCEEIIRQNKIANFFLDKGIKLNEPDNVIKR